MAQKQLSMKEIAQLAGVSVATVSHVVNNVGRFSEDTRKRVQDVIDQYGYVTNQSAKTLRQAQSRSIGMIVPDISNDFFSKIAYHVERTLAAQGYSVFVCNSGNDPQRERDYFHSLASKQADGIICISGLRELTNDIVTRGIPVVCIDRMPQSDLAIPHVGPMTNAAPTWQRAHSLTATAKTSSPSRALPQTTTATTASRAICMRSPIMACRFAASTWPTSPASVLAWTRLRISLPE